MVRLIKYFSLGISLIFLSPTVYSQSFSSHKVTTVPKDILDNHFDEGGFRKQMLEKYGTKFKSQVQLEDFIELLVDEQKSALTNRSYYYWAEATKFVAEVAKKTLPEEYFTASNGSVSILRSSKIEASFLENGHIFITLGLLNIIDNEAELAAVLSHEYGHFYHEHPYKIYEELTNSNVRGYAPYSGAGGLRILSKQMKEQENEADAMISTCFSESLYSLNSAITILEKYLVLQEQDKKRYESIADKNYFIAHPPTKKRIEQLTKQISTTNSETSKTFQVDSVLFGKIKEQVKDELIQLNFAQKNYYDCLYNSYIQHVKHPNDEFYQFFIYESLRRLICIDNIYKGKLFLTNPFLIENKEKIEKPVFINSNTKSSFAKSIFYNYSFVYPFNPELSQIKNSYTSNDTIEFITYEDAYNYFKTKYSQTCKVCNYTNSLGDSLINIKSSDFDQNNRFEKSLYDQISIPKKTYSDTKVPFFINEVDVYEGNSSLNNLNVCVSNKVIEMLKNKLSSNNTFVGNHNFIDLLNNMELTELSESSNNIVKYYDKLSGFVSRDPMNSNGASTNSYKARYNFKKNMPELVALAQTMKTNKILLVNIRSMIIVEPGTFASFTTTKYLATIYCININGNYISCNYTKKQFKNEVTTVFSKKQSTKNFPGKKEDILMELFGEIISISEKLIKN